MQVLPFHFPYSHLAVVLLAQLTTSRAWQTGPSPVIADDEYDGETQDARLLPVQWATCSQATPPGWQNARVLPALPAALSSNILPVRVGERFSPQVVTEPTPGAVVIDFGQNMAGQIELQLSPAFSASPSSSPSSSASSSPAISPSSSSSSFSPAAAVACPAGTNITVRHGELLFPNGSLWHHYTQAEVFTYLCAGDARDSLLVPFFTYYGFRYVEVRGFPGGRAALSAAGVATAAFIHTAVESVGAFDTTQPLLHSMQRALRYTALSNFQSVPTDCPQRERHGWMGDASIASESLIHNFDMHAAYAKWLRDISDVQTWRAANLSAQFPVTDLAPCNSVATCQQNYGSLAWEAAYTYLAYHLWDYYEDTRLAQTLYPGLRAHLRAILAEVAVPKHGTGGLLTYSVFGDWCNFALGMPTNCSVEGGVTAIHCGCQEPPNRRAKPIETAYYFIRHLDLMATLATSVGEHADAAEFSTRAAEARTAFVAVFRNASAPGVFGDGFQTDTLLALASAALNSSDTQAALAHLLADIASHGTHLTTGVIGTRFLLPVLMDAGHVDVAMALALQDTMPSWGYWLRQGATTLWESWVEGGSLQQRAALHGSLNHVMLGSFGQALFTHVAGLQRVGRGWSLLRFAPIVPPGGVLLNANVRLGLRRGVKKRAGNRVSG